MDERSIRGSLVDALRRAETQLPPDVAAALRAARERETSELAAAQLDAVLENIRIASAGSIPMCQDTGTLTFFVEAGTRSPFLAQIRDWISAAAADATAEIPLRPNTVDPFTGANPGDNTGRFTPFIHWDLVEGDDVRIAVLPKGGGSENASALEMLVPGVGIAGIERAVVEHVVSCQGKPCPPTILGIGIGGGADIALHLGKRAILRPIGSAHPEPHIAALERDLLELVNRTGVGPMGVGGATTSLAVHVEVASRHPASLPLGIIVQCWADRRAQVLLRSDGTAEVVS